MRLIVIFAVLLFASCKNGVKNEEEHFLNLKGNKIHVKSIGKGKPPILFVHGGHLDLEMWNPQVEEFKKTNRVIRFSDIGHGKSKQSENKIAGFEIIKEITKQYPGQKFVIVGHSWGAMLSVDFALNYPQKVEKLVLVSPGLNGWAYFKDSLALKNYKLRQKAISNSDTIETARLFHQNWVVGPKRRANELDQLFYKRSLDLMTKNIQNHWLEKGSELDTIKARTRLEKIAVPTYIIVGEEDVEDILLIAEEYQQRIDNAEKIEIANVAHLLNMENPVKFNGILKHILQE